MKRLKGIEMLRFVGIMSAFLCHTEIPIFVGFGAAGVSLIFGISGFVMTRRHCADNVICRCDTPLEHFLFYVSRIKKLYPLHILTMRHRLIAKK